MKAAFVCSGGGLLALLLAAGCQSAGQQAVSSQEKMTHVEATSQQILDDLLVKAAMTGAYLILETTITFPVPPEGDKNPVPAWGGAFKDRPKAVLQAGDQLLIVAKSLSCNAVETRYVFNPFTRTWLMAADDVTPEGNWLRVLFQGTVREFSREAQAARHSQNLLSSLARPTPAVAVEASFPLHATVAEMRADVAAFGLSVLESHLKAEHPNSFCHPDVHVYLKPATAK